MVDESCSSLSFDEPADIYDETRHCDNRALDHALDWLAVTFPPRVYPNVFEPGIGTGRIAIPLSRRGYKLIGVDISPRMLGQLETKLKHEGPGLDVTYQEADVTALPIPDSSFDMAVIVHLLYFIANWKQALAEILRVLRKGCPLILLHTGTGAEVPFINERYKAICLQNGHSTTNRGVGSTREAVDYLTSLGFSSQTLACKWTWDKIISAGEALSYIARRAYSFTLNTPPELHHTVIETIKGELQAQLGTLSKEIRVPNQIRMIIFEKEAGRIVA